MSGGVAEQTLPSGKHAEIWELRVEQTRTDGKVDQLIAIAADLKNELRELKGTFATKEQLTQVEARLKKIEEWNTWLLRIILGAFLAALCGLVYVKGGVPGP